MGWKASCILINGREPGYLGTMPPHDPERARRLIADLGLGPYRSRGMMPFEEGIFSDHLVVGAYDGAAVIGHPDIVNACLVPGADPMTARIMVVFPQAAVLRVGLHSLVNLWSYAYFERGKLLRAYGGAAEDGVVLDEGDLLAEEKTHFEKSVARDGQRFFFSESGGETEMYPACAFGEELVFDVMSRFLGCRLGKDDPRIDPMEMPMESFDRQEPRRWWWPFKRVYGH